MQGTANKQGVLGNVLCLEGPRSRGEAGRVCGGLEGRRSPQALWVWHLEDGELPMGGKAGKHPMRSHPLWLAMFQHARGPWGHWALPPVGASRPLKAA